jgi:hypothetical protein
VTSFTKVLITLFLLSPFAVSALIIMALYSYEMYAKVYPEKFVKKHPGQNPAVGHSKAIYKWKLVARILTGFGFVGILFSFVMLLFLYSYIIQQTIPLFH